MTELAMMTFLAIGSSILIAVASHQTEYVDPRWIGNALLAIIMVTTFYYATFLWAIKEQLEKLVNILSDDDGELRMELKGTIRMLADQVKGWRK